jgi:KTSC domain
MSMNSVSSSAIAAVGFERGTLAVLFHTSDTVYLHHGVPYSVYAGLMQAASMGAYYNAFIRGRYR